MKHTTRGFSLIELMVGLVIGLLTSIAVAQAYSLWVKQSRTVSSTNDALSTSTLAAYALDLDLKQAGQGFGTGSSTTTGGAGCPITASATIGTTTTPVTLDPAAAGKLRLTAVQIINGVDADGNDGPPDQIITFYGSSSFRVTPEAVLSGSTFNIAKVNSQAGFNLGDVVVLADGAYSDCRFAQVTSVDPTVLQTDKAFGHDTTSYQITLPDGSTANRNPVFNQPGGVTGPTFIAAFNLGPQPQANQWRISTTGDNSAMNPALQKFSILPIDGAYPSPRAREVAEGVVNLQAQYGYDANDDGRISDTEWVNSTDIYPTNLHVPNIGSPNVQWRRVLAIRYAILTRSRNYEPPVVNGASTVSVTNTAPSWAGGSFTMTDIGGIADTNPDSDLNWRRYRYSVAEGVIPIRNALWGRNQ